MERQRDAAARQAMTLPAPDDDALRQHERTVDYFRTDPTNGDQPKFVADVLNTGGEQGLANMHDLYT